MRYLIAIAAVLLIAPLAHAADITVTWTHPTVYTDGSALPVASITQTRVEYGTCTGTAFGTRINQGAVTGSAATIVFRNLPPATYCFRAYTTASGVESAASVTATKVISQPAPGAPSNLTVTDLVAYEMTKSPDGTEVASIIGVLPQGSLCSSETRELNGLTYRRVDPRRVDLVAVPDLPVNAWALCAPAGG